MAKTPGVKDKTRKEDGRQLWLAGMEPPKEGEVPNIMGNPQTKAKTPSPENLTTYWNMLYERLTPASKSERMRESPYKPDLVDRLSQVAIRLPEDVQLKTVELLSTLLKDWGEDNNVRIISARGLGLIAREVSGKAEKAAADALTQTIDSPEEKENRQSLLLPECLNSLSKHITGKGDSKTKSVDFMMEVILDAGEKENFRHDITHALERSLKNSDETTTRYILEQAKNLVWDNRQDLKTRSMGMSIIEYIAVDSKHETAGYRAIEELSKLAKDPQEYGETKARAIRGLRSIAIRDNEPRALEATQKMIEYLNDKEENPDGRNQAVLALADTVIHGRDIVKKPALEKVTYIEQDSEEHPFITKAAKEGLARIKENEQQRK
ncbi:MAG TPA: hypothetical protein ENN13_04855 [Candidatus Altiarchaeales archaeon]|nr:hypothetical protein [Candidatus Altiarchaeales archaeon]